MGDKELIKKFGLEESVKRFKAINEYTFITSPLTEEDGDDDNTGDDNMPGGDGPSGGDAPDMGNQPPMGNAPDMGSQPPMGNAPDMGNQPQGNPPMGNAPDMGNQPPMGNAPDMGNASGPLGSTLPDNNSDGNDDEEVIDVDELTDSQEDTEKKVDAMGLAMQRIYDKLDSFMDAMKDKDTKLDILAKELERRLPNDTEKLNIRSQASAPFNMTPGDYWQQSAENHPNYEVVSDNGGDDSEGKKVYTIRKSDVENINPYEVAKSFDTPAGSDDMSLEKLFSEID